MYPVLFKPQPHPVKTPFGFPELGFVRVERKTKCVQKLFQFPHRAPQYPACRGKDDKVIHVAGVAHAGVFREQAVQFVQVKCRQHRAQGGATTDAAARRVKVSSVLNAVVQKLPQQVQQYGMADVTGELVVQALFINGCVITLYVGTEHKGCGTPAEVMMYPQGALATTAVSFNVFTQRMDRQGWRQDAGQHF